MQATTACYDWLVINVHLQAAKIKTNKKSMKELQMIVLFVVVDLILFVF